MKGRRCKGFLSDHRLHNGIKNEEIEIDGSGEIMNEKVWKVKQKKKMFAKWIEKVKTENMVD